MNMSRDLRISNSTLLPLVHAAATQITQGRLLPKKVAEFYLS